MAPPSLRAAFDAAKAESRSAFVGFITACYPNADDTVPLMRAMTRSGCDVLELGVPYSDPLADGPTIQAANAVALENGASLAKCLSLVKEYTEGSGGDDAARSPVVLMGYCNPFLAHARTLGSADAFAESLASAGVSGVILVDLPLDHDIDAKGDSAGGKDAGGDSSTITGADLYRSLAGAGVAPVPLIAPTTAAGRVPELLRGASGGFAYCVSVTGVTGARSSIPEGLGSWIGSLRASGGGGGADEAPPLAVGFGISTPEHVREISRFADGVVVGSAIVRAAGDAALGSTEERCESVSKVISSLSSGCGRSEPIPGPGPADASSAAGAAGANGDAGSHRGDLGNGMFGAFGGRYIPETLAQAHDELIAAYAEARADPSFAEELATLRREYVGGPTPVHLAKRLTEHAGGAEIWLKREDLAHTGAHKINNALGQVILAKRLGKKRVIAETGAGQHGVATATACALLGIQCVVYMGAEDCERQALNVFRMKFLGAEVNPVSSGTRTLKDAINEAMRDWVTNVRDTHYIIGSTVGPHPFPTIVRDLQSVIGKEARAQMLDQAGALPDAVVACVGGGSNAMGIFHPMVPDESVRLIGVEAGGARGVAGGAGHCAPLSGGTPGVLHGQRSYLMQSADGQVSDTASVSAGLDYPSVGPEHSYLKDSGRAEYTSATDDEALEAMQLMSRLEGIIPALETSHAVSKAVELAKELGKGKRVLIMVSGRGDKDMVTVAKRLGVTLGI